MAEMSYNEKMESSVQLNKIMDAFDSQIEAKTIYESIGYTAPYKYANSCVGQINERNKNNG